MTQPNMEVIANTETWHYSRQDHHCQLQTDTRAQGQNRRHSFFIQEEEHLSLQFLINCKLQLLFRHTGQQVPAELTTHRCPSSPSHKTRFSAQGEGVPVGCQMQVNHTPGQKHGKAKPAIANILANMFLNSNQSVSEGSVVEPKCPNDVLLQTKSQRPQRRTGPELSSRPPGAVLAIIFVCPPMPKVFKPPPMFSHTPCTPQSLWPKLMQK